MFDEENKYLDFVLKSINDELEKSNKQLKELWKVGTSLSFEDKKRGEHLNINSKASSVEKLIKTLEKSKSIPYFGRFDFSFDLKGSNPKKIYIGRNGISSNGESIVTDWRAPISSLYYDSEIGKAQYTAPGGIVEGYINLKRQINIKDSKLIDVQDTAFGSNDELLKPYLSVNADNKMKIIISSIQKEQNDIIRKPSDMNLIVQGVAGSGKTSVALHRIAYLIYLLGNKVSSDQFLILGPNDYFLNYVSSILPDLETSPVDQKTLIDYTSDYLEEKINLKDEFEQNDIVPSIEMMKKIQAFKSSLEYRNLIGKFLNNYMNNQLVENDFVVNGECVFKKEYVMDILSSFIDGVPNFNRAYLVLSTKLKDNLFEIYDSIRKKNKQIYSKLPIDSEERKKMINKSSELYNILKKDGCKLLKKYIKDINLNATKIYMKFILELGNLESTLTDKEILYLQKYSLSYLQKKKICFEDIPALLYIKYKMTKKKSDYKYIIIDEAQDYGMFHFAALKEINNYSNFAIYGDLAQSIYSYRSIDSWDDVNNLVFDKKCEILNLRKSYRTTMEITENANKILEKINLNAATPVIRHGVDVSYANEANNINYLISKINEFKLKEYKTIAIICKEENEAKKLNKILQKNGINSRYISNKDSEYSGGIFVLTSSSSKGLEFDAVIIKDASKDIYMSESDVDMHLLYVASTRALHELEILYDNDITSVYEDKIRENKVKTLKMN